MKCDRTKPCSACCARGHPRECEFIVGEGSDYSPIQQSYEIRKLRAENQRLKERLQASRLPHSGDEDDDDAELTDSKTAKTTSRAAAARQRRFKTSDRVDNLYFGTPGLANIVHDVSGLALSCEAQADAVLTSLPICNLAVSHSRIPCPSPRTCMCSTALSTLSSPSGRARVIT